MSDDTTRPGGINVSSRAAFFMGIVGGVLLLCTAGFFVLLPTVVGGKSESAPRDSEHGDVAAAEPAPEHASEPANGNEDDGIGEVAPVSADDHARGNNDTGVIVYLWSDFQCPYCAVFHETMNRIMDEYDDRVLFVYRHYPLPYHAQARPAANAAECADEQGAFWEYADGLYADQEALDDDGFAALADGLGLDRKDFDECYAARRHDAKIAAQVSAASAAGVSGTPASVVVAADGSMMLAPGALSFEQMASVLEAALAAE